MATASVTGERPWPYRTGPRAADAAASPGRAARVAGMVVAEYRARRARRALAGLSEHLLDDIGIDRGGIDRAVRLGRG